MSSVGSKRKIISGGTTPDVLTPSSSVTDALPKRRFQRRNSKVGKMFFDDSNSCRPDKLHHDEFRNWQRRCSLSGVTITSPDKYGILSIPEEEVMKEAAVVIMVQDSTVHSSQVEEASLNGLSMI